MQPNPFLGVLFHSIGAFSSASCYTPQKQTKLWAWEVYWLMTATSAWLILPITVAMLTIPDYFEVLRSVENVYLWKSFGYGVVYGVGGLMFGLGIRYIGFSLNYAIAIGFSACLGTVSPLLMHPNKGFTPHLIVEKFSNAPGLIVWAGILFAVAGIAFCGYAGWLRERSGAFWYFQFFFYGIGHWHMGEKFGFTSWVLHMSMLILFSNFYGWLFKEWEGTGNRPRRVLHLGMAVIVAATLIIAYGNYLGEAATPVH